MDVAMGKLLVLATQAKFRRKFHAAYFADADTTSKPARKKGGGFFAALVRHQDGRIQRVGEGKPLAKRPTAEEMRAKFLALLNPASRKRAHRSRVTSAGQYGDGARPGPV